VTFFLLLHLLAAVLAPVLVRWWDRQAFLALALVPAAAFGWLLTRLVAVTDGGGVSETTPWIPALDLEVALPDLRPARDRGGRAGARLLRPLLRAR
jgi:multicomponent Na+:H+ antiporter subunit A